MHLGDILDIMSEKAGGITLHEAMHIARNIMELHSADLRTARGESYDEGYQSGHEVGKSLVQLPTPEQHTFEKYERVYNLSVARANSIVGDVVRRIGKDRKIQCIKELRTQTGLGLKDTKDIVDEYVRRLDQMEAGTADYGDEPPF